MKKRVAAAIVSFVVVAICLAAMITTPLKYREYQYNSHDVIAKYNKEDAVDKTDTSFIIDVENVQSQYVSIKLNEPYTSPIGIKVYLYNGDLEKNTEYYNLTFTENEEYVSLDLTGEEYSHIRIETIHGIQIIENVEFHSQKPVIEEKNIYPSVARNVFAAVVAVLTGLVVFFADMKLNFIGRINFNVKKIAVNCGVSIGCVAIASVIAVGIDVILCLMFSNTITIFQTFNYRVFILIDAFLLMIIAFIRNKACVKTRAEVIVFKIIVIMGMAMVIIMPPKHGSWDIDSHYKWALSASSFGKTYVSQADFDFYSLNGETFPGGELETSENYETKLNEEYKTYVEIYYGEISIAHIPAGVGIAITRFFGMPFSVVYRAGEAGGLLAYALLCYLAIKKLKSGKMIAAVVALFPTNIFLASCYSYDWWVTGFTMVGMAYFVGNCQRKEGCITTKDTIIMVAAFALACIPKQVYIMFMLIPFLMPRHKIENKKKYYFICSAGLIFLFLSFAIRSMGSLGGTGDTRGGAVNPQEQIYGIITDIPNYAAIMFNFLKEYFSLENMAGYINNFANYGMAGFGSQVCTVLMIVVACTDKNEFDINVSKWYLKAYMVITFVTTAVLMASAMYISFTPVGLNTINGCQPRYLTPLIYPLLATIGSGKIINKMNKYIYNYAVLGLMSFSVLYGIFDTILPNVI